MKQSTKILCLFCFCFCQMAFQCDDCTSDTHFGEYGIALTPAAATYNTLDTIWMSAEVDRMASMTRPVGTLDLLDFSCKQGFTLIKIPESGNVIASGLKHFDFVEDDGRLHIPDTTTTGRPDGHYFLTRFQVDEQGGHFSFGIVPKQPGLYMIWVDNGDCYSPEATPLGCGTEATFRDNRIQVDDLHHDLLPRTQFRIPRNTGPDRIINLSDRPSALVFQVN